jgi:hypothetical protein
MERVMKQTARRMERMIYARTSFGFSMRILCISIYPIFISLAESAASRDPIEKLLGAELSHVE